jgi:hypothetical protein
MLNISNNVVSRRTQNYDIMDGMKQDNMTIEKWYGVTLIRPWTLIVDH